MLPYFDIKQVQSNVFDSKIRRITFIEEEETNKLSLQDVAYRPDDNKSPLIGTISIFRVRISWVSTNYMQTIKDYIRNFIRAFKAKYPSESTYPVFIEEDNRWLQSWPKNIGQAGNFLAKNHANWRKFLRDGGFFMEETGSWDRGNVDRILHIYVKNPMGWDWYRRASISTDFKNYLNRTDIDIPFQELRYPQQVAYSAFTAEVFLKFFGSLENIKKAKKTHRIITSSDFQGSSNKIDPLFSSKDEAWRTPDYVFDYFNEIYDFNFDAAASKDNARAKKYFTKKDNALKKSWCSKGQKRRIWLNPPYSRNLYEWIEKAYEESKKGCLVGILVYSRTDTKWWHDFVMPYASTVHFIQPRLKFLDSKTGKRKGSATAPSVFIVFDGKKKQSPIFVSDEVRI